nr:MAG TPA: hypothetical protein [Caudoviricetes sp.]
MDSTAQPTGLKREAQCERKPRSRKGTSRRTLL